MESNNDIMMYMIRLDPVACPRPRVTSKGFVYYPAKYTQFKRTLEAEIAKLGIKPLPEGIALSLKVRFAMPKPKSGKYIGYHYKKPDLDNLVKSLCDGLEGTGILHNDSQIAHIEAFKSYSDAPCIIFQISPKSTSTG